MVSAICYLLYAHLQIYRFSLAQCLRQKSPAAKKAVTSSRAAHAIACTLMLFHTTCLRHGGRTLRTVNAVHGVAAAHDLGRLPARDPGPHQRRLSRLPGWRTPSPPLALALTVTLTPSKMPTLISTQSISLASQRHWTCLWLLSDSCAEACCDCAGTAVRANPDLHNGHDVPSGLGSGVSWVAHIERPPDLLARPDLRLQQAEVSSMYVSCTCTDVA